MKELIKLRSPWVIYERKLWAMFRHDPDVDVDIDEKAKKYVIHVKTAKKADALARLLGSEVSFGSVTYRICVIPANVGDILPADAPIIDVVSAAFDGNECVHDIRPVSKGLFRDLCYVVFENRVIQFEADNLSDVNGNISTLMEDIAREVLPNANGALFCTTVIVGESNKLDKPLGEWP